MPSERRLAALLMRSVRDTPAALALVEEIRALRKLLEGCDTQEGREEVLERVQLKLVALDDALKLQRLDGVKR